MLARRAESEKLRARLDPIFTEGKVQLVVSGHDHDYQHHVANGIHYIVSGGGGAPLYSVTPDLPFVRKAVKTHHYCEVSVDGNKLHFKAVEPNGTMVDEFELDSVRKND